ncbi:ribosome small subunit-dependent GTPase A [Paenibacillus gorillae]|uniref:ribosome small subunit-dependent GTPase A n=1 Tax=Paenibacillus gorillae TaxID=1243662 RepID=UPI00138B09FA|nr:ribosome small subunit-dependent GTPase A [Paenibacillus gorillae]
MFYLFADFSDRYRKTTSFQRGCLFCGIFASKIRISTKERCKIINLQAYGYRDSQTINGLIPARIIEIHREQYKAICEHGEVAATLKGSFVYELKERNEFPAVGDFVWLKYNHNGSSSIVNVMPRQSKFSRTDFSGHAAGYVKTVLEQVVAANFDYVFIMSSLNQDFNVNRIARYLTLARQSGGLPVIVLTKADLCETYEEKVELLRNIAGDIDIIALSSFTKMGLERLSDFLKPAKTIVFLGSSGIGKSSLLNALAGHELMAVKEIREDDARGRHTTTHRQLVKLPSGALIIDTPGMRELGLWQADEGISASFSVVEQLFAGCRFSDCNHNQEPGCAVQTAIKNGSLTQEKWSSYLAQKRESGFVARNSGMKKGKKKNG